jgi:hypothetical protein
MWDMQRYLSAPLALSADVLVDSTAMMDLFGGIMGRLSGGNLLLANLPATLISFCAVRWGVEKLKFREYVDHRLLFLLISLPNFCVWTSVVSKEVVGLVYSVVLGVLTVRFLQGDFRVRLRDLIALYLCFTFKPQYVPFIVEGLVYIYVARRWCRTAKGQLLLGVAMLAANAAVLLAFRTEINEVAQIFHEYFFIEQNAQSNRNEDIWQAPDAFFTKAPAGMFIAFVGPTFGEMLSKPMHFLAGLESSLIVVLFLWLGFRFAVRNFVEGRFSPLYFFSYFVIVTGIALVHYPFGIFNPGSAIRYRTNFIMLFIILLLHLYDHYNRRYQINIKDEDTVLRQHAMGVAQFPG